MRRRYPYQSRRKPINATDSTSAAAALYALELKRKSLRNRHQFLQESLNSVATELSSVEEQIRDLQAKHQQLLNQTSLYPRRGKDAGDNNESDTFILSY